MYVAVCVHVCVLSVERERSGTRRMRLREKKRRRERTRKKRKKIHEGLRSEVSKESVEKLQIGKKVQTDRERERGLKRCWLEQRASDGSRIRSKSDEQARFLSL